MGFFCLTGKKLTVSHRLCFPHQTQNLYSKAFLSNMKFHADTVVPNSAELHGPDKHRSLFDKACRKVSFLDTCRSPANLQRKTKRFQDFILKLSFPEMTSPGTSHLPYQFKSIRHCRHEKPLTFLVSKQNAPKRRQERIKRAIVLRPAFSVSLHRWDLGAEKDTVPLLDPPPQSSTPLSPK